MRVNEITFILMLIITLPEGCVDPYYPDLEDSQQSLVINGTLTDKEGNHYIHISLSVPYTTPENIPEQNCIVEIIDETENVIWFYESEPGLYETQPQQIHGNISNINNEDETVLGFFNVSGLSEKRVFVSERFNFFPESHNCVPWKPMFIPPNKGPIWVILDARGTLYLANQDCFDCTKSGGITEKPDFWE